ncbi:MAG TPA: hypothetical protein VFV39_08870 [Limnobacter sp.]|nr:hypothetical protein [Limnobacter sp.]
MQLLIERQLKQISASLLLGMATMVFLFSIYVLSTVMYTITTIELIPYVLIFGIYALAGSFGLGMLARYAFIRHQKRVELDIRRILSK